MTRDELGLHTAPPTVCPAWCVADHSTSDRGPHVHKSALSGDWFELSGDVDGPVTVTPCADVRATGAGAVCPAWCVADHRTHDPDLHKSALIGDWFELWCDTGGPVTATLCADVSNNDDLDVAQLREVAAAALATADLMEALQ